MSRNKVSFVNTAGDELSAILELPIDQKPHNIALFAHCFTCNKNFKAVRTISRELSSAGFGVLSFDFTGLGMSAGEFEDTNFSSSVDDLIAAAEYLANTYSSPSLIVGHSLGGSAAIMAAAQLSAVKAVVTIGSPSDPGHVKNLIESDIDQIKAEGAAKVSIGGRPFTIKKQFVEDLERQNLSAIVNKMEKSLLVMHSPQDSIVGIENAAELYQAARHPKSFVSLDGADHMLTDSADSEYAGSLIASWARKYVDSKPEKQLDSGNKVIGYLDPDEKFTTQVKAGNHRFVADEPVSYGGNDFGPSPYQLLASGLAACTVMTLRLYADRKKWYLGEVYCSVDHEKSHIEDCRDCESSKSKIDVFTREISFSAELDEQQTARLLEIADKCPVHRTLEASSHIKTSLKTG